MHKRYTQMSELCPFSVVRFESLTGQFNEAIGMEPAGMLLLASQCSRLPEFQHSWSIRLVLILGAGSGEPWVDALGLKRCRARSDTTSDTPMHSRSEDTPLHIVGGAVSRSIPVGNPAFNHTMKSVHSTLFNTFLLA